jgi:NADH-quinone oxidoreductase subunit A
MDLAAYLLLFIAVGAGFILVHLLAGKLIRPNKPGAEKGTIYECGEPTIGSAWVQFDLRFYVVALLFVIFDVEVAFFFPWAEVFGKANAVAAYETIPGPGPSKDPKELSAADREQLRDYGDKVASLIPPWASNRRTIADYRDPEKLRLRLNQREFDANRVTAHTLGVLALGEIVVFFGVLLIGFAYLWRRGDLEWVRSLAERAGRPVAPAPSVTATPALRAVTTLPSPAAVGEHGH